ncbi:MAG: 3-deoxy-D-manno-octulosonic acid transferase [Candidatus Zixiibacteriota bacterium]|nr:MAG: 3-deoxy-D-manno-octulosonic acid transferase [candidate division Zixibacteria bacterium]
MFWLYRLITGALYWIVYPVGRRRADRGDLLWKGRLGLVSRPGPSRVWLHAASVGEVGVCGHLINFLLKESASVSVHLTTMTRTGFSAALKRYHSERVSLSYFPLDCPAAVRKTLDAIGPDLIVITETEIWPNLIHEASRRDIPLVQVNGRMTGKAFDRYRRIRGLMKSLLNRYDRFFFKTEDDAARYHALGLDQSLGIVVGDMKFDAPLLERSDKRSRETRRRAGIAGDAFLFVAGSTRPGEEAVITNAFRELAFEYKKLSIVIAPRHIERAGEVKSLLDDKAIDFALYGDNPNHERFVLVDRLGILNDLYRAADLAFVGGSLVDIGGHNILEPVWAGCPVLFGPSLFNVREAADYILERNYGAMVRSEEELVSLLRNVLAGDIIYATKQSRDLDKSPTAIAGTHILEKLKHA